MELLLYIACAGFILLALGLLLSVQQTGRKGLLLPAAAYGATGIVGIYAISWWPLAIGFSLARFLGAYGVGTEPKPAQRPSAFGMLINHAIHLGAGAFSPVTFSFTIPGLVNAAILALIIQGPHTLGDFTIYRRLLAASTREVRDTLPVKFAQMFVFKMLWYCGLTLLAAWVITSYA